MRTALTTLARSFSIIGHPFLVVPAAVIALAWRGGLAAPLAIIVVVCGVVGTVAAFSFWQVRRGRWQHVDAIARPERRSLNVFIALVLFFAAAITLFQQPRSGLGLALLLSAGLMTTIILTAPWIKLSLHASFAAFAVALLWPLGYRYLVPGAVAVAGICWSRVSLGRHTVAEALGGCVLGCLFGASVWLWMGAHG